MMRQSRSVGGVVLLSLEKLAMDISHVVHDDVADDVDLGIDENMF